MGVAPQPGPAAHSLRRAHTCSTEPSGRMEWMVVMASSWLMPMFLEGRYLLDDTSTKMMRPAPCACGTADTDGKCGCQGGGEDRIGWRLPTMLQLSQRTRSAPGRPKRASSFLSPGRIPARTHPAAAPAQLYHGRIRAVTVPTRPRPPRSAPPQPPARPTPPQPHLVLALQQLLHGRADGTAAVEQVLRVRQREVAVGRAQEPANQLVRSDRRAQGVRPQVELAPARAS